MKGLIFLFALIVSVPTYSLSSCDELTGQYHEHRWEKLTQLYVRTIITDIEAKLCIGFTNDKIDLISYEDDSGNKEIFPIEDLLLGPLTLLTDEDISVGGILKSGKIMTMVMKEIVPQARYQLSLNFLRNLAKIPLKRDHRQLTVEVKRNDDDRIVSFYKIQSDSFNEVEINISSALNINEAKLYEYGSLVKELKTTSLPKIKDL